MLIFLQRHVSVEQLFDSDQGVQDARPKVRLLVCVVDASRHDLGIP
jgi:hypothetical protein